jgi:hypothetical protein
VVAEVTKANLEECKTRLSVEPKWTTKMETLYNTVPAQFNTDELRQTFYDIAKAEYERLRQHYLTRGNILLADSKSLLEVAVKNKPEAEALQASLASEHKQADLKVQNELVANKESDLAFAAMDNAAPPPPAVKVQLKIEVEGNDAWLQIMAYWYANDPEARTMDLSKTLSKFKTFCEKHVNANPQNRIMHKGIKYVEDVKAKKG